MYLTDRKHIPTPDWQYGLDTYRLALNKVALILVNSQVIGATWTWCYYADWYTIVPSRINLVFSELNTGAASLCQVLRIPETSYITSYEISLGNPEDRKSVV